MPQTPEQKAAAEKAKAEKAAVNQLQEGQHSAALKPIVFLRSHPNYAYNAGNKATLSQEHTDLLVNGGFARFDEAETAEAPTDEQR
ncbi:hypothetical protein [Hymenobacter negativus]|uniref:Uncharacterized protein n=1 Tax=Hymenobacter negativus TaxID=2795026 RepID=A0ABS0Q8I4_9BACT|nr:hypothetical protein [Hymenobacter negativus]MBH8558989.1 hypothetical protein [Hymenobacter negativus]